MNYHFLLLYFMLVGVANAATIKLCVQTNTTGTIAPLSGAAVTCYDDDLPIPTAMTGENKTNSSGCVYLTYKKKTPKWYNPCAGWDCAPNQNPDIFCVVNKGGFHQLVTGVKMNWSQDKTAYFRVTMEPLPSIKICVQKKKNGTAVPLSGAKVKCKDEDDGTKDEAMTGGKTGSNGCVTLTYEEKYPSASQACGWDCLNKTSPDIYCEVTNSTLYPLYTDHKEDWHQKKPIDFGVVTAYPNRSGDEGKTSGCGTSFPWPGIPEVDKYRADFEKVCNNHNKCYCNCNETKRNCDSEFGALLNSTCNQVGYKSAVAHPLIIDCKTWAYGMYAIAKTDGKGSYNSTHRDCCHSD